MNSNPFNIEPQNLSKVGEELSRVPFGSLIGNILTACVDAQENASKVAWDYTKTVLSRKTPMVFTFMEGKTLKRLEVPLVTIVPLPYMRIDDVAIAFDANVEVDNSHNKQFLVQINNENSEGKSSQTAKASANIHIDIDAGTTDLPVGLASLLDFMSGGFIVEDVKEEVVENLPLPDDKGPKSSSSSSSGQRSLDEIIVNVQQNGSTLRPPLKPSSGKISSGSGSGKGNNVDQIISNVQQNGSTLRPPLKPSSGNVSSGSGSGKGHNVDQIISNVQQNCSTLRPPLKPSSGNVSSGSGKGHNVDQIISNVQQNCSTLETMTLNLSSGSGYGSSLDDIIETIDNNAQLPTETPIQTSSQIPSSSSGVSSVEQVIASIPENIIADAASGKEEDTLPGDKTSDDKTSDDKPSDKQEAKPSDDTKQESASDEKQEEKASDETKETNVFDEADAEHFSEEIDAKMKESSEKNPPKPKPMATVTVQAPSSSSGYRANITFPDTIATEPQPYGGNPMLALHVNWTKPSRVRDPKRPYAIEDFDLLSTILSALLWQRFNGPIKLYTDNVGYNYYKGLGMLELWNGGVDTEVLEGIPDDIPADIFWAGAKLFAIRKQNVPFLMMDTDLMVWSDIRERLKRYDIMAYHPEDLKETGCYIDYQFLKKPNGYKPDAQWDWTINPYNTALTYFANDKFLKYYTDSAIEFMRGNTERPKELVSQMVFAEQRLFAMCAKYKGISVGTFLSSPYEDSPDFTHIWGGKDEARNNPSANNRLCATLAKTIAGNFKEATLSPQVTALLKKYNVKV